MVFIKGKFMVFSQTGVSKIVSTLSIPDATSRVSFTYCVCYQWWLM